MFLFACLLRNSAFAAPVFDYGSPWQYLLGTTEASSPRAAWRENSFNAASWQIGPTPIGYANPANNASESAIVTFVPSVQEAANNSVFFRKTFNIANPSPTAEFTLNVNVDDGFVAWLNGFEIGRYNFPEGVEPAFTSTASGAIEATVVSIPITNTAAFVAGQNTIAIQVFNANNTSSDLLFDAALESTLDQTAPIVDDTTPTAGQIVTASSSIEVLFSENVQGVGATDLFINGKVAASMTVVSPRNYVFHFSPLGEGSVTAQWAADHNITDLSNNAFAGGMWGYTVNSAGPPANVIISEFMADNENGIRDDDSQRSDWIEIYNAGADAVDLGGWFLTDTTDNPTGWRIPPYSLGANKFLIIWASEKNRTNINGQFHTNFKLSKSAGYLALVNPRTNIVSAFAPTYPTQRTDISYGRDAVDPALKGFFNLPTPGERNSAGGSGFGPDPVFSLQEGVYTNTVITVAITSPTGQIRYTRDGSAPTASSPLYTGPINITNSTTLKARVFQTGVLPSAVVAKAYMMVDSTVANFTSKLPVIMISTSGRSILDHPPAGSERTFASIIGLDTFRGIASTRGEPDYVGQGGISIRGQTSAGFPKRPYRLELRDEYGNDRDSDWFGLPEGSDWVLNNPYSDKPFLQNFLAQELFENMGHYAVRRRFVEVFINTSNRKVTYPGDYHGIYILLEKIKIDKNRVPIERLSQYDNAEPKISGGYMFKKDKDSAGDLDFYTTGGAGFSGQGLKIHEPAPREITSQQFDWLVDYINRFENALYATDWKTRTGTNHYSHYIDVDAFVDQHWIVEFAKQIDGYRLSNYFSKDRNGKIKMEPIWDYNLSFGNADYLGGGSPSGWYWNQCSENQHIWLRRLMCGTTSPTGTTGDADFNQRIADRWSQLRTNVLNSTNVLARVDQLAALLSEAADRDFKKWPRLGTYVWPNSPQYVSPTTYAGIITAMKNFIRSRYTWLDSQFIVPPKASLPEGKVPAGITVTLTGANTIYYTLDGSDPRLPGGAVNPAALTYSGPFTISKTSRLLARSRSATKWSGPTAATYVIETPSLAITEIMYHPAPPTGAAANLYTDEDFEYLEFKNTGSAAINLGGFSIVDGVSFTFPSLQLAPGARTLVVKSRAAFQARYGTALPIAGEFIGQLDNAGETITVLGSLKEPVLSFTYSDDWLLSTDGPGFALVPVNENAGADLSDPASWRTSKFNGTPAAAETVTSQFPIVVINEILPRPAGSEVAQVELRNLSSEPADISGWFITDDFDTPKKFRVPTPTVIPAGRHIVFTENDFRALGTLIPFILDRLGEAIYIFSADAQGILTGYVHGFEYGARKIDETIGRVITSDGRELLVPQLTPTLGDTNSSPVIPAIVINEIMYQPPDVSANGALWNNTEDEYIEIDNRSNTPVDLFDAQRPTNRWKLTGGADFIFPAGATLPAGGYALVINFDPVGNPTQVAAFKAKYNVPASVQIFGPFSGNLNNGGERISIEYPDAPIANGIVPYIVAEDLDYDGNLPWPLGPNGGGFSLSRKQPGDFGNDPIQWNAARPTPGAVNAVPASPTILEHPASLTAAGGQLITLRVVASGQNLRYQWRFNGETMANERDSSLNLIDAQSNRSGEYSVVVMNNDGAVLSDSASITIDADFDRDGIGTDWEVAYGFNPVDPSDANVDADSDGALNSHEFVAGTDPRSATSVLALKDIETGNSSAVTFDAGANRTYTIQFSDTLNPPVWQKLTNVFGGTDGGEVRITDPGATSTRYYRIVSPAQP